MSIHVFADQSPAGVAERDAVLDRAIEIRETTTLSWEGACLAAERERDLNEMDAPSDWDAGTVTFDPYV